jgi:hypothetical protein
MHISVQLAIWTAAAEGAIALFLTVAPHRLPGGQRLANALGRAPLLDAVVALLTWVPWVVAVGMGGWLGLVGALAGQAVVLMSWTWLHEAAHPRARRGPRVVKVLNRIVGRAPNHLALWVSLLALPGFWAIRLSEIILYPPLRWLLGFPGYRHAEWVNVSRHKFDGLVGHDLIWCLYCDWMTGVYALGAEMLRNVESFWCPIRYYDAKKCENCRIDFPDIDGGWVAADGSMPQVETLLDQMYGSGRREWFGHPVRLTISVEQQVEQRSSTKSHRNDEVTP